MGRPVSLLLQHWPNITNIFFQKTKPEKADDPGDCEAAAVNTNCDKGHGIDGAHGSHKYYWVGRELDEDVKSRDDSNKAEVCASKLANMVVVLQADVE